MLLNQAWLLGRVGIQQKQTIYSISLSDSVVPILISSLF